MFKSASAAKKASRLQRFHWSRKKTNWTPSIAVHVGQPGLFLVLAQFSHLTEHRTSPWQRLSIRLESCLGVRARESAQMPAPHALPVTGKSKHPHGVRARTHLTTPPTTTPNTRQASLPLPVDCSCLPLTGRSHTPHTHPSLSSSSLHRHAFLLISPMTFLSLSHTHTRDT